MINVWFFLPVFAVGYFLGWKRGNFIGVSATWVKAKVEFDRAVAKIQVKATDILNESISKVKEVSEDTIKNIVKDLEQKIIKDLEQKGKRNEN